ncbi:MAG TPA: 4-alpha-glucanotransferase [Arthrobacter sp.]|nr:4-alpha-glucanotransferase [Arthrobacter sp.]
MAEQTGQNPHPADEPLMKLARAHGIGTTFQGWDHREQTVSTQTLRKVLSALGVPAGSQREIDQSLTDAELAPWQRMLPPVVVSREDQERKVPLHVPAGTEVRVWILTEDGAEQELTCGSAVETRQYDGGTRERREVTLPAGLPLGWHTFHASCGQAQEQDQAECTLVVTPQRLSTTGRLLQGQRWGLMAQLYSIRSTRSWSIGDLADLAELAAVAADKGADFVLINPLHAAEPAPPVEPSPYLPTTRRFFNPLYIRVEDIPEYAGLEGSARDAIEESAESLRRTNRSPDLLDRDSSYAAKLRALEEVYLVERPPSRQRQFETFVAEQGQGLEDFALWCAMAEALPPDAREWSDAAGPDTDGARRERRRRNDRMDFYRWLQWICDEQLEAAQGAALKAGMDIGVVHDLAVGVSSQGADAWSLQDVLASGIHVGAPPDMFNQQGQDWGQPPWHPSRLAEAGYAPYRDMLRTVLRHAGGIRVDHILGLFRLWWIPQDSPPGEGAYVYYDHEALIGILALEAQRANAVVIGEDLGLFEPEVQDYLAERGILGTSIFWFEQNDDGPLPPSSYRRACLTSVTTHDLPPTAGYLKGAHVDLRDSLGLLNRPVEEERAADTAAQEQLLGFVRATLADGDSQGPADKAASPAVRESSGSIQSTVEQLHAFIARTPSALLGVALTDAVGEIQTQNQPGTSDEYPNWRIPLTDSEGKVVLIDDLPGNQRFASLARSLTT